MLNQGLKDKGTKYQVLPNFGMCCRELGGSKLRVFAHACAVSDLAEQHASSFLICFSVARNAY